MVVPAWTPAMILDGAPLPASALIRNFQGGMAGYVDDAAEQALLHLADMANLREMRKHEVFLSIKRDLVLVSSMNISQFLSPWQLLLRTYIYIYIYIVSCCGLPLFYRLFRLPIGLKR